MERQRLKEELTRLKNQLNMEMRGRLVPTPKAAAIRRKITAVEEKITQIDKDAAERLALNSAPIDDILEIIAIPLLADVLNYTVAGVDGMLRRRGCQETVFGDYVRQIRRAALAMVDTLDMDKDAMPKLLEVDDTLMEAIHKKLMSFIKQRLNITK